MAKTWMWSDVVKGLKIKGELETANSDNNGKESEETNSVEKFHLEEPNHLKAKLTRGQQKSMPARRS